MRTSYLICYDICDDKRLRKVFQTMRGYGDHLQFSVFECQLTATDLAKCRAELAGIINHAVDKAVQGRIAVMGAHLDRHAGGGSRGGGGHLRGENAVDI